MGDLSNNPHGLKKAILKLQANNISIPRIAELMEMPEHEIRALLSDG